MKLLSKKDFLFESKEEGEEEKKIYTINITGSETGIEQLRLMAEYFKANGEAGHSLSVVCDPDGDEPTNFGWDGDGSDKIDSIDVVITTDEIEDEDAEKSEEEAEINEAKKELDELTPKEIVKAIIKKNAAFKWLKTDLPAEPSFKELEDILNKYGYGKELDKFKK